MFQNGVNALSKIVFKNPVSCQKAQNFMSFGLCDFVQISPACGPNTYYVWRDFRLPMSALATVAGKSFNGKFTVFDQVFFITIADADIGSLKSLHTLFGKYLEHMLVKFEQNRMVRT